MRLVAIYADEGVSGSNGLDSRRALPEALSALRERRATGLVVYRLDRLARDLIVQETLLAEVRRLGCEVFSTSGGEAAYLVDDPDDPSRRLIRQVLGAVSEYERSMISLRLRSGRRRKAAEGGYAFGSPPMGYRSVDGVLIENAEEQATLARIEQLRAEGRSVRQIAQALNDESRPTKRGADRWHPTTVARILRRASFRASSS
jgi:DNA invertase Pin-like site-specific DNA recombinase